VRTRPLATLFVLSTALCACGESVSAKPNLPDRVSAGWKLTSLNPSAAPPYIPYPSSRHPPGQDQQVSAGGSADCWQAVYAGLGAAQIWLCRFGTSSASFDAWQRVRADSQTVKFQEGVYLVLVKWSNTSTADLNALMRATQSALRNAHVP
jgi:hypothetical protein